MRWQVTALSILLAGWTLAAPAAAQVAAPEAAILKKVGETYRRLTTYLMEGTLTINVKSVNGTNNNEIPFLVAAAPGGKTRDEIRSETLGGSIVSNGKQTFLYNRPLGQYMRRTGPADSVDLGGTRGFRATIMDRYRGIAKGALSAKRLPDAPVVVQGVSRDCYVLEVSYPPSTSNAALQELPRTYWIEKATSLVLRQQTLVKADALQFGGKVEQSEEFLLNRTSLGPALPESLWVFRPPAGTKEVPEFITADASNPFVGKLATDFTLRDAAGKSHTLKSLRGKVVLLDFWATWCRPCRVTMPRVAKIHTEYKDRGVEVMSINCGEAAEKASAFMKQAGYTFTTLLDPGSQVSADYQVNSIPTLVVINRDGIVSDYMVGVRDEAALRAALKKAGVN